MKVVASLVAALAVSILAGGCGGDKKQNIAEVRVMHAIVDVAEPVDVLIDGNPKYSSIAFGGVSGYAELFAGARTATVQTTANASAVASTSVGLASGAVRTLILYGTRGAIGTVLLNDEVGGPASGKFKLRVVNVSPNIGNVDIYLTNGAIAGISPTISNVPYAGVIDFTEITAGTLRIVFTATGTKDVLFESTPRAWADGAKLTLVVMPSTSGGLVGATLITSDSGALIANPLGRVKAVNAATGSTAFNFKVDGTVILPGVTFAGISAYATTATGTHTLQVESAAVPGSNLASVSTAIASSTDYSVAAVGTLASPELVVFTDDNTTPFAGFARVRFVNLLAGSASLDAYVNTTSQATGIAYKASSGYYALAAATDYTLAFMTAGGAAGVASLTGIELVTGATYTLYLVGPPETPLVLMTRDH